MKNKQTITQYFGNFVAINNQKQSYQNGVKRTFKPRPSTLLPSYDRETVQQNFDLILIFHQFTIQPSAVY